MPDEITQPQPIYIQKRRSWWPWAIVVLLVIVVFGQWKCYHDKEVKNDAAIAVGQKVVDSVMHKADSVMVLYDQNMSAYDIKIKQRDSVINGFYDEKQEQEKRFSNQIVSLTFQRNKFRTAAEGHDTSGAYIACDQFMKLYDSAYTMAVTYKNTLDSLLSSEDTRHGSDSVEIVQVRAAVVMLRQQLATLSTLLKDTIAENTLLKESLAKTKKGRKWLVIAGILVGAVGEVLIHK